MLIFNRLLAVLAGGDRLGATLCRIAVGVVFIWIGLLKFIPYEADSITPQRSLIFRDSNNSKCAGI